MIKNLSIQRFKSIKSLSLQCRKVNLFIGAPDTGKTNILEALYFLSRLGWSWPIDSSLRLSHDLGFDALFYRQFFDQPFEIKMDEMTVKASIEGQSRQLHVEFLPSGLAFYLPFAHQRDVPELEWMRFYSYVPSEQWQYATNWKHAEKIVTPPHGYNLMYIARHHEKVYDFLKETVSGLNWKLRFDQNQKRFRLSEIRKDEILDYNLELLSDSLKRLFFYGAIMLTSENATLVFDEPDVFAFPPYPKTLGEMMAMDRTNQFFVTTHNPYFLAGIVEKTPAQELAVFVCHRGEDGATSAKLLSEDEVKEVIEQGASVFFNLRDFLHR